MYCRILLFAFYRESGYQMSVFRKMNMFTLCVAKGFMFTVPYIRTVNKVPYQRYTQSYRPSNSVFLSHFLSQNKRILSWQNTSVPLLGLDSQQEKFIKDEILFSEVTMFLISNNTTFCRMGNEHQHKNQHENQRCPFNPFRWWRPCYWWGLCCW